MARLTYDKTKPFSALLTVDVSALIKVTNDLARIKAVADSLTAGGVTPANLEASAEFGIAAGQGATFYADLQNIQAGLAAITCLPALDAGN